MKTRLAIYALLTLLALVVSSVITIDAQSTSFYASGIAGSPTNGEYWGYNGSAQGWYTPTGSGTVNSGTANDLAYYAATGTAVSQLALSSAFSISSATLNLASQSTNTVCGNISGSSAAPVCTNTLANLQSALVAANAITYTPTALASGATNDWDPSGGAGIATVGVVYATPNSAGSTVDGILAGSDKQQILLCNAAPAISPLQSATSTATIGGSLAAATYYYVVTATSGAGETLASNQESQVTTGSTSTVTVSWAAVPGATGYRVYRGTSSGGENTYYAVSGGSTVTYTDTGSTGTSASPPATVNNWIKLQNQSTSDSTAANRLASGDNAVLMGQGCVWLAYTTSASRWQIAGNPVNGGPTLQMFASSTSLTPAPSWDFSSETASASGTFTFDCPATPPIPWKKFIIVFTNYSGSANSYTWSSCYHASSSTALPTAGTAAGAEDLFVAFWDPVKNVYDTAAYNQGF